MLEPVIITISSPDPGLTARKAWFLSQPGCRWETEDAAEGQDLPRLSITRKGVFLSFRDERLSFHPSMALLRLINIYRGLPDRYLEATALQTGDVLLDATLGLGTDALMGAWAVGKQGKVLTVESSPYIAAIVKDGLLKQLPIPQVENMEKRQAWADVQLAARNIEVYWDDNLTFMQNMPPATVDVVYFDPMFRHTREKSASIKPLHLWADASSLRQEAVAEACRVARKRVVLKERKGSKEFARLGFEVMPGGRYSSVDYGVIKI
ncbi:class I SAM-dependent methyltransferase [Paradesulfitobacterium aromaticivorans]